MTVLGRPSKDIRMHYIAEKVSHHPPVMACHASGKGWEYWGTSAADSKVRLFRYHFISSGSNITGA